MTDTDITVGPSGIPNPSAGLLAPPPPPRRGEDDPVGLLEAFRADMAEEAVDADAKFPHKYRPGYEMTFSTDLAARQLLAWQKRCVTNRSKGELDSMKLSSIILANQNTGIIRQGIVLVDPASGDNLTFQHPLFWRSCDTDEAVDAVQRFYVKDGYLQSATEAVLRECGYDDEVAPDPTNV